MVSRMACRGGGIPPPRVCPAAVATFGLLLLGHDHRLGHGRRRGAIHRAPTAEMMIMALLLLWTIDATGASGEDDSALFAYLSLFRHYQALLMGLFNSADVAYYLLFSTTFLGLTIRRLDNQRLQH